MRRIDGRSGIITTVAGTAEPGYGGDGGPATGAAFNQPYALDVDANGDLYIVDRLNAVIRKVDAASGIISTVAGTGAPGSGGDGGPAREAALREPNDCFLDGQGGLLIADVQDQRIRRLDLATGIITTFAGNGDKARAGDGLAATDASILGARAGVRGTAAATPIFASGKGNGVRRVDAKGIMSTFAGTGERGYDGRRRRGAVGHLGVAEGDTLRRAGQPAGGGYGEPRDPAHRRRHGGCHHRCRRTARRPRRRRSGHRQRGWTARTAAAWMPTAICTSPTATTTACASVRA